MYKYTACLFAVKFMGVLKKYKKMDCNGISQCHAKYRKMYRKAGVKSLELTQEEQALVEQLVQQHKKIIDSNALLNMDAETNAISLTTNNATVVGRPGDNDSQVYIPDIKNSIILHYHPNHNKYRTQLKPSVNDLLYSINNKSLMINVNPRNTDEYVIYKGGARK